MKSNKWGRYTYYDIENKANIDFSEIIEDPYIGDNELYLYLTGYIGKMSKGHNALVSGNDIRVGGDKEGVGVRFINAETAAVVDIPLDDLARNTAKEIILLVPADMPACDYYLEISTQISGSTLLKETRIVRFDRLLTVE